MVRFLICGFGPFPGFPDNPAAQVVGRLRDQDWSPPETVTRYALMPTTWTGGPETALATLAETRADAVLLIGVAGQASAFRVETQARNQASTLHPDADGALHLSPAVLASGTALVPATAPVEAMVAALAAEGLPVEASSDAGDYLCNYTFYRVLADGRARHVGFLHIPPPQPGLGLDDLERGVRAATTAFAAALVPTNSPTFA